MAGLTKAVTGHGTFIYNANATISKHGNPDNVAKALEELDMQHAWIRVHGARSIHKKEPTQSLINAIKSAGVAVAGWGWCQGEDIDSESRLAIDALERFQLNDYIADIEYGVSGAHWTTDEVTDFFEKIRNFNSEGALGVSSHGFIDWHKPELMAAANPLVDFFAPQVYWFWYPSRKILNAARVSSSEFPLNDPESYARLCIHRWRRYIDKPIIITGQAYWGEHEDYTQQVAEAKFRDFVMKFKDYATIKGLNWWHLGGQGQSAMSLNMYKLIERSQLNSHFRTIRRIESMVTNSRFLNLVTSQEGDSYVFGAVALASDSDPDAFDCSELVEWACARLEVEPRMPDGSWNQAEHCKNHGTLIEVDEALNTPGALLFIFSSSPFEGSRPNKAHVAISLGNGKTFEARSRHYGVGTFSADGRGWTHAALIPGIEYEDSTFDIPAPSEPESYSITVNLPRLSYQQRSKGREVKTLQGLLHARGHGEIVGNIDGDFGSNTDRGVREFQRRALIEVDGIVGLRTWEKLIK